MDTLSLSGKQAHYQVAARARENPAPLEEEESLAAVAGQPRREVHA